MYFIGVVALMGSRQLVCHFRDSLASKILNNRILHTVVILNKSQNKAKVLDRSKGLEPCHKADIQSNLAE